jgi:bifunctional non-homologous end joining protein LigD
MNKKKSAVPKVVPMLATLLKEVYTNEDYVHEVKWDGYRIIAYLNNGNVKLQSRGGQDYTDKYSPVVSALKKIKHNLVLDGEVCVLNSAGHPDFDALQKYSVQGGHLVYYVFDLLWKDGYNLMELTISNCPHFVDFSVQNLTPKNGWYSPGILA